MRIWFALAVAALAAACSNPWGNVPVEELPKALRFAVARPSKLVFGNYCGFGTRTGDLSARPVDRLDALCYEHDSCYVDRRDHCECDGAFLEGARAVRDDPAATDRMRRQASILIAGFSIPVCKAFPEGFLPPRPRDRRDLGLPAARIAAEPSG
jgi:hypothetical protein